MKLNKNTKLREFIQVLGTEAMRNVIHPDVWINAVFADYIPLNEYTKYEGVTYYLKDNGGLAEEKDLIYPNWLITDVRFQNEKQVIEEKNGIVIRVNRPKTKIELAKGLKNLTLEHHSEKALDFESFDYIIENNSSIQELVEKVKNMLICENIL